MFCNVVLVSPCSGRRDTSHAEQLSVFDSMPDIGVHCSAFDSAAFATISVEWFESFSTDGEGDSTPSYEGARIFFELRRLPRVDRRLQRKAAYQNASKQNQQQLTDLYASLAALLRFVIHQWSFGASKPDKRVIATRTNLNYEPVKYKAP